MARCPAHVALCCSLALLLLLPAARSATFTMTNNCGHTVWPGLLSGAGTAPLSLSTTGFALPHGASATVDAPAGWSGRVWARTLCATDAATGNFTCATGDCGSGSVQCNGGASPPATLAEFTLDGSASGLDLFHVSLVDGYNIPMLIVPRGAGGGRGKCMATGCLVDLNGACPADLRVMAASTTSGGAVACRSACEAFGTPRYCCSGAYGNPNTCRPSAYSHFFKNACPRAYSYAFDDSASTFTCATGISYGITFCPSTTPYTGGGSSSTTPNTGGGGGSNSTPYTGGGSSSSTTPYTGGGDGGSNPTPYTGGGGGQVGQPWRIALVVAVLGALTAALGVLAKLLGLFKLCCSSPIQEAGGAAGQQ